jgi:AcrR family transcriptional regulator
MQHAGTGNSRDRQPLNRERVLTAAVELADELGLEALTMRRLSARLGFEVMALYNHIVNKDDLIDGMIDQVYAEIELPPESTELRQALRQRAMSARSALVRHPWAIPLMESRPSPGPANLRHHDSMLGHLRRAGFTIESAVNAYWVLDSYIYGFALQESSLPTSESEDFADSTKDIIDKMPSNDYPHLTEVGIRLSTSGYNPADEFEVGLDLILGGLERLHRG